MFTVKITNPFVETQDRKGVYTPVEGPDGRWVHNAKRVTLKISSDDFATLKALAIPASTTREKLLRQAADQQITLDASVRWVLHSDRAYEGKDGKQPVRYIEYRPEGGVLCTALDL